MLRSLVAALGALLLPAAHATNSSMNATNATPAALCCALEMVDSYGDGWDGVTIEIATNASALTDGTRRSSPTCVVHPGQGPSAEEEFAGA